MLYCEQSECLIKFGAYGTKLERNWNETGTKLVRNWYEGAISVHIMWL